ncbi:MAG: PD40 domain-containing protein [Deltaproteobacteria bacterium]|nr:PD40 domain-containing protein [Deltaproteobacteria bacterium]
MYTKRLILGLIFFSFLQGAFIRGYAQASNVMPVHVPLRQTESAHFIYIYETSLEDQIPSIMRSCEDAHSILSPVFNWVPKEKTVIMYSDVQDIHNGWATVYPRPMIMLYASDAPPESTIYEPGDYMRRTIFHEYTHILSMDAQYGTDATLTDIFGRVFPVSGDPLSLVLMLLSAPPGLLAPPWYKEGLSTWAETEFVGPGRGRSTRVDMILRMAVSDNRLLRGNDWFFELPEWPYENAAYLYGLKVMQYIHDQYGFQEYEKNVPGDVSNSVAHSFMFAFNKRSVAATGKTFQTLAREAMDAETSRQNRRVETLLTRTPTNLERFTPKRLIVTEPKFGFDGKAIYFSGWEEADRNTLFRYDMESRGLSKLSSIRTSIPLFTDLASSPDRRDIYYTRLDIQGRDQLRNELYCLDTHKDQARLISKKGRYRYPAISPDGRNLAAVQNIGGSQSLLEVAIENAGKKQFEDTLVGAPRYHTIVDPAYSPDGEYIVYVMADEKGSQLRKICKKSGNDEILLQWPCMILSPVFHPSDGNLIFVSDKNGVYNLYQMAFGLNPEPMAITHTLGGLFSPDFSPDGKLITAVAYDSHGYYLTILDYGRLQPMGPLPVVETAWKSLEANQAVIERFKSKSDPEKTPSKPYHSFRNIGMDFWSPWMTTSRDGVMGGLSAAFSDPTQFQNLYVLGGAESHYGSPVGTLVYQYSGFYPILTLYGATLPEYYTDLIQDSDHIYYHYDEEVDTAGMAVSLPWLRVDRQSTLTFGYQASDRAVIKKSQEEYETKTIRTRNLFEGQEGSLWAQFDFFNATAFGRSHSYEDGRYIKATFEWTDESLGSDINRRRTRGDWHEYIRMPWFENHTLKLEGVYGKGSGDETAQGLFGLGGYFPTLSLDQGLNRNVGLRGYPSNYQVGDEVEKGGVAYRFTIFQRYKNINATSPFYLHQIFGEVFYEGGKAKGGMASAKNEWIDAAGVEVNLSTTLFRFLPVAPGIGMAYAFDYEDRTRAGQDDEEDTSKLQIYISLKTTVNF